MAKLRGTPCRANEKVALRNLWLASSEAALDGRAASHPLQISDAAASRVGKMKKFSQSRSGDMVPRSLNKKKRRLLRVTPSGRRGAVYAPFIVVFVNAKCVNSRRRWPPKLDDWRGDAGDRRTSGTRRVRNTRHSLSPLSSPSLPDFPCPPLLPLLGFAVWGVRFLAAGFTS
jgi:hypothetical protein